MEQILLAYDPPKEMVTIIMMLYKIMKAMVHSLDGDTEFFNIVAGVPSERYISTIFAFTLPRLHTLTIYSSNKSEQYLK